MQIRTKEGQISVSLGHDKHYDVCRIGHTDMAVGYKMGSFTHAERLKLWNHAYE